MTQNAQILVSIIPKNNHYEALGPGRGGAGASSLRGLGLRSTPVVVVDAPTRVFWPNKRLFANFVENIFRNLPKSSLFLQTRQWRDLLVFHTTRNKFIKIPRQKPHIWFDFAHCQALGIEYVFSCVLEIQIYFLVYRVINKTECYEKHSQHNQYFKWIYRK